VCVHVCVHVCVCACVCACECVCMWVCVHVCVCMCVCMWVCVHVCVCMCVCACVCACECVYVCVAWHIEVFCGFCRCCGDVWLFMRCRALLRRCRAFLRILAKIKCTYEMQDVTLIWVFNILVKWLNILVTFMCYILHLIVLHKKSFFCFFCEFFSHHTRCLTRFEACCEMSGMWQVCAMHLMGHVLWLVAFFVKM